MERHRWLFQVGAFQREFKDGKIAELFSFKSCELGNKGSEV